MTDGDAGDSMHELLAAKLRIFDGPAYRKAYLTNLLESEKRFSDAGNTRSAAYCFEKVAGELAHVEILDSSGNAPDEASPGVLGDGSTSNSQPGIDAGSASVNESSPGSSSPKKKATPPKRSPMDLLRVRWRQERIKNAESILKAQSGRLSALEKQSFQEKLDKLSASEDGPHTRSQSAKLDKDLLDIRHRLYRRVLKAQKAVMRSRRLDGPRRHDGPRRLDGPLRHEETQSLDSALPRETVRSSDASIPLAASPALEVAQKPLVSGAATLKGPLVGPYNDRYNLGDLLALMGRTDPAWVDEFLDLYRGLDEVKGVLSALAAQAKK